MNDTSHAAILVVDNDPALLTVTQRLLQTAGHAVITAADGTKALRLARQHRPDLVLLDVHLPDLSGFEVCRQLKGDATLAGMYILLISGAHTDSESQIIGLDAGADGYIVRPISNRGMLARVQAMLRIQAGDRALRQKEAEMRELLAQAEQSRQALAASEEKYRRLAENAPDIIYRYELAPQPQFSYVSPAVAAITGYTPAEFYADPRLFERMIHPEDRPKLGKIPAEARVPGEPVTWRWLHKEGRCLWIEQRYSHVYDAQGLLMAVEGIARDVSERVQAQEQLHLQATTLANVANAIIITDSAGVITWVNPAFTRLSGYTLDESVGRNVSELVRSGVHDQAFYQHLWKTILAGQVWQGELTNRRKDGSFYTEEQSITPVLDAQGRVQHFVAVKQDITARKQHERELETMIAISAALRGAATRAEMIPIILDHMLTLLDVAGSVLMTLHRAGGELRTEMGRGVWAGYTGMVVPAGAGASAHILASGQPYLTNAARQDTATYHPTGFGECAAAAGAPLIVGKEITGVLWMGSQRALNEQDLRLLTAIAGVAAGALHRSALHEQTSRSLQQLSALRAIDQAISGTFDLAATLDLIVTEATRQLQVDAAAVLLLDRQDGMLRHAASHGFRTPEITGVSLCLGEGRAGLAALERRPMIHPDWREEAPSCALTGWLAEEGFIAHHITPMIAKGQVQGVLEVFHRQRLQPDEDWRDFFATLATQAAIALHNASLYQELQAYTASLEERVMKRTAELEEAYAQLRQAHGEMSRALAQERELHELKTRFIAMASHEFRTPLTIILSSAELLERYGQRFDEQRRLTHLHRIQATTKRMNALLDDMLLLGRAEAGRLPFHPQPLDLVAFCREVVADLRLGVAAQHLLTLTVAAEIGAQGVPAILDEQLLRHILNNLLSNAVKYSPPGSRVEVMLHRQGEQAILEVQDEGIGIPVEDQPRLFEPFYRAHNAGSAAGTGLGMNVVKRAVDLHGGAIAVHSAENQGTRVVVTLPLRPPAHLLDH